MAVCPESNGEWQRLVDTRETDGCDWCLDVEAPAASARCEQRCHCSCEPDTVSAREKPCGSSSALCTVDSCTDSLSNQRERECQRKATTPQKRLQTARLRVSAMCCEVEVGLVKETLEAMEGVVRVTSNVVGQRVVVHYDAAVVDIGAMVQALNAGHLGCTVQENGSTGETPEPLLGFRLAAYYVGLVGFFASSTSCWFTFQDAKPWLAIGTISFFLLYATPPVIYTAWNGLRRCKLDISALVLVSTASTLALQDPFDASLVIFLFGMARFCERMCLAFVQQRLSTINIAQTRYVILAEPGRKGEAVLVEEVPTGTLLSLRTGDQIPLDGIVVQGCVSADESALTGEAKPVAKEEGDVVYAGTVVQTGYCEMRTTALATESTTARIQRLVEEGQAEASDMALLVDRFAHFFTPGLLLLAILVLGIRLCLSGWEGFTHGLHTSLLILVLACPCSLVLATPIATVCSVAAAAQACVIIKTGGIALDRLAALDVVAMDKTGTLTEGVLRVTDAVLLKEFPNNPPAHVPAASGPCAPAGGCCSQRSPPQTSKCCGSITAAGASKCCSPPAASTLCASSGCCSPAAATAAKESVCQASRSSDPCCGVRIKPSLKGRQREEHHRWVMWTVAALEASSNHPLASALIGYYCSSASAGCVGTSQYDVSSLPTPSKVVVHPGKGLQGTVNGAVVVVGNQQLMEELRVGSLDPADERWQRWAAASKTVVFVAIDGELEMVLALADQLRQEAAATVQQLQQRGLHVVMLTGDTVPCAATLAEMVGVTEVEAELQPEHKQRWVVERQSQGQSICMVGDGINDGPALSQANVGIAMGAGGTALATQAADVILLSDRLSLLPAVHGLAQRCRLIVRLNIATALLLKLAMLVANFCMALPLWSAIVADMAALVIVFAMGMTLLMPIGGPLPPPPSTDV